MAAWFCPEALLGSLHHRHQKVKRLGPVAASFAPALLCRLVGDRVVFGEGLDFSVLCGGHRRDPFPTRGSTRSVRRGPWPTFPKAPSLPPSRPIPRGRTSPAQASLPSRALPASSRPSRLRRPRSSGGLCPCGSFAPSACL